MAGSANTRKTGCPSATRGNSNGPEVSHLIGFGGTVEPVGDADCPENLRHVWHPAETVEAVAYDTPVVGWRGGHVNTLRLWSARAPDPLRLDAFNQGDHIGAAGRPRARQRHLPGALSQRGHPRRPGAAPAAGILLLLRRPCTTSCYRHVHQHGDIRTLPEHAAIQLNDTHPAIAIAELMRILVDVHDMPWEEAWEITQAAFSYTNHTLLPEALEAWPVHLMERLLPRHMQIIYLINALHLDHLQRRPAEEIPALMSAVSLIDEHNGRQVRMGSLAFLGAHKVNGVSALHTEPDAPDRVSRPAQRCIRTGSSTRPTASPSAAGCSRPIRA